MRNTASAYPYSSPSHPPPSQHLKRPTHLVPRRHGSSLHRHRRPIRVPATMKHLVSGPGSCSPIVFISFSMKKTRTLSSILAPFEDASIGTTKHVRRTTSRINTAITHCALRFWTPTLLFDIVARLSSSSWLLRHRMVHRNIARHSRFGPVAALTNKCRSRDQ